MKKTLVALAALAVVGAASAQSSVTLYGRIDTSIGKNTVKTTNAAGVTTTTANAGGQMFSGQQTGSRWGMRGSEDLGGGLKAIFNLEGGIDSSNGVVGQSTAGANPRIFGRVSTVGFEGGFGKIEFGRLYTPYDSAVGPADAQGYGGYSVYTQTLLTRGIHVDGGRADNAILYSTPAMGGFSGQAMYAFGENGTPALSSGSNVGLNAIYANGPLAINFGWESVDAVAGPGLETDAWNLGASYNLGVVRLSFGVEQAKQKGLGAGANGKDKGYALGLSAPLGPVSFNIGYGREKTTGSAVALTNGTNKGWTAYANYALSKRTSVYGGFFQNKFDAAGVLNATKTTQYAAGVIHNF